MKISYWLYLETFVHLNIKNEVALLYNTLNGESLIITENVRILGLLKKLQKVKNFYVIRISSQLLKQTEIGEFISKLRDRFMGDLLNTSFSNTKPVQQFPSLRVNFNIETLKKNTYAANNLTYLNNLTELTLYICYSNSQSYKLHDAYKQFTSIIQTENKPDYLELKLESIREILEQIQYGSLRYLNICGGLIHKHSEFNMIVRFLSEKKGLMIKYFCHYLDIDEFNLSEIVSITNNNVVVLFSPPFNENLIYRLLDKYLSHKNITYQIVVTDVKQYDFFSNIVEEKLLDKDKFQFFPLFNGNNKHFFINNIYISEEQIMSQTLSQKDILIKSILNTNFFGKLTIMPNGDIFSNCNLNKLGNIHSNLIDSCIKKELQSRKSWRKSRKHQTPCKRCTYNMLCPPISNYELLFNKNNLCNVLTK